MEKAPEFAENNGTLFVFVKRFVRHAETLTRERGAGRVIFYRTVSRDRRRY